MQVLRKPDGFSLLETVVAIGVLITGVFGAAAVLSTGMQKLSGSPSDVIVSQKATQAIESVFAARDSHRLTWAQIKNVTDGGVFLDGAQPVTVAGNDGLVGTADDGGVETIDMGQGHTMTLSGFTRQIQIADVAGENGNLRSITVTLTYQDGPTKRTYVLRSYISAFA